MLDLSNDLSNGSKYDKTVEERIPGYSSYDFRGTFPIYI